MIEFLLLCLVCTGIAAVFAIHFPLEDISDRLREISRNTGELYRPLSDIASHSYDLVTTHRKTLNATTVADRAVTLFAKELDDTNNRVASLQESVAPLLPKPPPEPPTAEERIAELEKTIVGLQNHSVDDRRAEEPVVVSVAQNNNEALTDGILVLNDTMRQVVDNLGAIQSANKVHGKALEFLVNVVQQNTKK